MPIVNTGVCLLAREVGKTSRLFSAVFESPRELESKSLSALRRFAKRQHGFTLIEMVATMALLSILLAMAAGALSYYFSVKALETSARELTSEIREAQAMAVATGNTYRLDFSNPDMRSYKLQRRQGAEWIDVRAPIELESSVEFSASPLPDFGSDLYLNCDSRGRCEDGQLTLKERFGKIRVVHVDGETANVNVRMD